MQPRFLSLHSKTREKLFSQRKEAEKNGYYRVARRIHSVLLNDEEFETSEKLKISWRNYDDNNPEGNSSEYVMVLPLPEYGAIIEHGH